MELVLWVLGGLLLLGAAAGASEPRPYVAKKPDDDEDDIIHSSTPGLDDDVTSPHYGQGWHQWQAVPSGGSYSHGWMNASADSDTTGNTSGSVFCPAVNVDGTPMATCFIDIEGKPYGVTDIWSDQHGIGGTYDFDHGTNTAHDFTTDSSSTHLFDDDWMSASSGIDHSWDDRW
jgi:hypothetical protein